MNAASGELYLAQNLIKVVAQTLNNADDGVPNRLCVNGEELNNSKNYDLIMVLDMVFEKIENSLSYLDQPEVFSSKRCNL